MSRELLIINADDWGRSSAETDSALSCFQRGAITSVTAMVFMADSERAAAVAKRIGLPVGLHLNLCEHLNGPGVDPGLRDAHRRIATYLARSRFSEAVYHPALASDFRYCYESQWQEFVRLYGRPPTHIDGHRHRHLAANMVIGGVLRPGEKVRRSFDFWPGEKGRLNRMYRQLINWYLARRYRVTDYFFSLSQCQSAERLDRVLALATRASVELMAHPIRESEREMLISGGFRARVERLRLGSYQDL